MPVETVSLHATTRIKDQVAVTRIEQELFNPNPARFEGTFLFPVPKGAQLDKFTMHINGKPVEAELLAADKARRIYEDIVRRAQDPALLEYADRDVFKVRIFPFEPRERKQITLSYTQVLRADNGLVACTVPLNAGRQTTRPIKSLGVKVELETSRPLKMIYSPSHSIEVKYQGERRATVGFEATDARPEGDFQLFFAPEKGDVGMSLLTYRAGDEDGFFLLLASPGFSADARRVMAKDVAFVLDTSGSMAGKKLDQAKKALRFCVENLNDGDRFEVLRFSTDIETVFGHLAEATRANRDRALEFIKELKPIGGTAIHDALQHALKLRPGGERPFVVIFLTDGLPTVGITQEDQIVAGVKAAAGSTRVFCFGIGTDVNAHLLDKITETTRAVSQYVLPEEDIEVKVSNFFSKINAPVLANPSLAWPAGMRVTKLYPAPLPDLFRGEQLVAVGRYSAAGAGKLRLEGAVNGERRTFTFEVSFPAEAKEHDFIPRLWATRRVGYLLDEIRLHGENQELKDEVTELARRYGVVTPYTAYLILEDEARRGVPLSLQSLPQLREDGPARQRAADSYRLLREEREGLAGVAGARSSVELKLAENAAEALRKGQAEAGRSLGLAIAPAAATAGRPLVAAPNVNTPALTAPAPLQAAKRLDDYVQNSRFVAGKNFFQNGAQWVDAGAQKQRSARKVQLKFGSPEYFEFYAKNAAARPWLALGRQVQFLLNDTLYEVVD
jgi:Ca-activated chloride channel family protein